MHARRSCVLIAAFGIAASVGQVLAAAPDHLRVPEGYEIETVAAPPLVGFPMMGGFDDRGRLYLAESAGHNLDAKELAAQLPNFVRRLEDRDGDGRFDDSTIFADRMTYPMGALWHDGSVYVASPPYIWKLTDADDDGVAEEREQLVGKFGYVGNAADIHGCFLGPEGRIYWCDGRHGHEFVDEQGQVHSSGKAARIFSCRADGSDIQAHCGGGMDNPVEIDFTPGGDMLGTVNLMYQKRGDCLVHWMYGGVYPRDDQPQHLAEFKRTGGLMPEVFDFGHVAVSGMLRCRGGQFGEGQRLFVCEFNTHKLVSLRLERDGSTWRTAKEDFLVSTDIDFHPTDVIEAPDGSLLVVDTGGWFRNGCPTSQVAKPEIKGGIYRITRRDAAPPADALGAKLTWGAAVAATELIGRLGDDRPWIVRRAQAELARRGGDSVAALSAALGSPQTAAPVRTEIVWTLARVADSSARSATRAALRDGDATVRQAAAHVCGTRRDTAALADLSEMVVRDEPPVRREAATALGKLGRGDAVASLLTALSAPGDRLLEHALIYALIQINDPSATVAGLADSRSHVRRAALVALDQMGAEQLTRDLVAPLLDTDDAALQQAAVEVISKRPGWAEGLLERLEGWLDDAALDAGRTSMVRGALLAFRREPSVQTLIGRQLASDAAKPVVRQLLLDVVARSDLAPRPAEWTAPLLACLSADDDATRRLAVTAASAGDVAPFATGLARLTDDAQQPAELRRAAAAALGKGQQPLSAGAFAALQQGLTEGAALERMASAEALGAAALGEVQRRELLPAVAGAGPLELSSLLHAYDGSRDAELGHALIAALRQSPGRHSLPRARVEKLIGQFDAKTASTAADLLAAASAADASAGAKVEAVVAAVAQAEPARGKDVFFSQRAACSACHRIGTQGDQVGPDLSRIGGIRTPRDLAESIVLPSLTLARGYESYQVSLRSGLSHAGVIRRESADTIWLRTADRAEVAIARSDIEDMAPSAVSIMPVGLDQVLPAEDLAAVVAYLASLKE